jgi:GNAT superfamily N-acetyltransferase
MNTFAPWPRGTKSLRVRSNSRVTTTYLYEPLDPAKHDRATFSCGVAALDRYIVQQASQDMRNHVAAVYVQRRPEQATILGYYSISNLSIEPTALDPALVKRLPKYPVLPATLIGRLAVDSRYRGQGLGALLLFDALLRGITSGIASVAMVVDAKDENARLFYERFGFRSVIGHERRLYLPTKDVAVLIDPRT